MSDDGRQLLSISTIPAWAIMWGTAIAIYLGCKWLTWSTRSTSRVPLVKALSYWLLWPGMNSDAFLNPYMAVSPPAWGEWVSAVVKFGCGLLLVGWVGANPRPESVLASGWIGMVGIVMTLHFGLFHLLSCAWRSVGVAAQPIMNSPLQSTSLGEFWGRRWNTAFRDLSHRFLFRPLVGSCGIQPAMMLAFLMSGIIHEVVITLPSRSGYGGPTAFFALQACAITAERSGIGKMLGLGTGWRGWMFTMTCLTVPLPLLFPPRFVLDVVVPFFRSWRPWP